MDSISGNISSKFLLIQ